MKESLNSFLQAQIFKSLDLHRITIEFPPANNLAKSYQFLDDGTSWEILNLIIQDSTIMSAVGGAKSCVNDLLKYYVAFLAAAKHQMEQNCSFTPGSSFRQVGNMVKSQIKAFSSGLHPQFYDLGWVVTKLSFTLDLIDLNGRELGEDMSVIDRNNKARTRV